MKNRIDKTYLLALCAGMLLLSACTKDESSGLPEYSDTQIIPQAQLPTLGIEQEPGFESRAIADPTEELDLFFSRADETGPGTGVFGAYSTSALPATRAAGAMTALVSFTTPQYYISNNARSRFTGWWPAATSFTAGVVSWTLDGTQDVLTTKAQDGSTKALLRTFVFEHKLSKLQFEVVASSARTVSAWGTISAVNVLAQPTTCTYTLSTDAATGALAMSGSTTYKVKSFTSGPLTTTPVAKGDPMLVAPGADFSLSLQVVSSTRGTVTVSVPARTYEAGKAYKLTLSFRGTEVAATVVPWNDVTTDDDMGSMTPISLTDNPNDSPIGISPKQLESKDKLLWQNTPSSAGATDNWDGKANTAKMTDSPAADHCRALGSNWYVPSHAQLLLLQAYDLALPASEQLIQAPYSPYWSSTEYAAYDGQVWVGMYPGHHAPSGQKAGMSSYVRCICDGPQPANSYPKVETGNTIVSRDNSGGIKVEAIMTADQQTWLLTTNTTTTQYDEKSPYNRVAAKFQVAAVNAKDAATAGDIYTACANYSEGSYGAGLWRLPTQREAALMWLLKDKLTAIDLTSSLFFWSSTYSNSDRKYWQATFIPIQGDGAVDPRDDNASVRCVRDGAIPPLPPKIGDFKDNGVVYWIDPADPMHYKVVSVTEWSGKAWAASDTYVIGSGAQSDMDGQGNAAAIKAYFDANTGSGVTESTFEAAFPTAAECYNYTGKDGTDAKGTWYLPAKSELQYLWCAYNGVAPINWTSGANASAPADAAAQTVFNKYLTNAGGVVVNTGFFWSGTENTYTTSHAWYVSFSDGYSNISDKGYYSHYVRCVRDL